MFPCVAVLICAIQLCSLGSTFRVSPALVIPFAFGSVHADYTHYSLHGFVGVGGQFDEEQVTDVPDKDSGSYSLTGDSPEHTGDSPEQTGDSPAQTGDSPEQTGDSPSQTGDSPEKTGDSPEQTGDSPEQTGDSPAQTGDSPAQPGDYPEQTGDSLAQTGDSPVQIGNSPVQTGDSPAQTDDFLEQTDGTPIKTGDSAPLVQYDPVMLGEDEIQRLNDFKLRVYQELNTTGKDEYHTIQELRLSSTEQYLGKLAGLVKHLENGLKRQYDENVLKSIFDRTTAIEKKVAGLDLDRQPELSFYRGIILNRIDALLENITRKLSVIIEYNASLSDEKEDDVLTRGTHVRNETVLTHESVDHIVNPAVVEGFKTLLRKFVYLEKVLANGTSSVNGQNVVLDHLHVS